MTRPLFQAREILLLLVAVPLVIWNSDGATLPPCAIENGQDDATCTQSNVEPADGPNLRTRSCNTPITAVGSILPLRSSSELRKKRSRAFLPYFLLSWPFMAAVMDNTPNFTLRCGGSLITLRYVLTAASCFADPDDRNPKDYTIMVGHPRVSVARKAAVESIRVHESYTSSSFYHDIALVQVAEFVTSSWVDISTVCLPTPGMANMDFAGNTAMTAGWGVTEKGVNEPLQLFEVDLPMVSISDCNATYSKLKDRRLTTGITGEFLCAGGGDKGVCRGDGGGPLMLLADDGYYTQVGIVSFSYGCAKPGYPAVYTRVSHYANWIADNSDILDGVGDTGV